MPRDRFQRVNASVAAAEEILATAIERGRARNLPYAGEMMPTEAWRMWSAHGAKIIDVRSDFEYQYIGRVPRSQWIAWKHWPGNDVNPRFLPDLLNTCERDDVMLFLCRSGVRSHAAAVSAAAAGYTLAFNVLEGFEGDLDASGQRGHLGGWRKAGLPWIQD